MTKEKTRPDNNDHCFTGVGREFWLREARGLNRGKITQGPDGTRIDYVTDSDGSALQNGGMFQPQETRMGPGRYFRFFGTINHNRYGAESCMAGGWWIEANTYFQIKSWAMSHDMSLAKAAQQLIVIPGGWHDCGYVGAAHLNRKLKAYVGKGKPATNATSPHNPLRNRDTDPVVAAPSHLEIKQYFVPGDRDLLSRFFKTVAVQQVTAKGRYL